MFKSDNGSAPSAAVTHTWRHSRSVDELIGICRGILADGAVNRSEAAFLLDWLERHREFAETFPFSTLYPRVRDAMHDGVLDPDEQRDLLDALSATVGGEVVSPSSGNSLSTELPFDNPFPTILHSASVFVVTGVFSYGKRRAVCEAIESRGGAVRAAVSPKTDYVVVGEVGSRDWLHSSYGRKIQEAAELRQAGSKISIIPERHWLESLS
ncbi:BRCT domain-containing protein [Dyella kyungheensis]|uniref:BRCT domain-containing protein n=1 Tax=Dyella kyungheensis TaxID=1242174 RepID=A0ABS2JU00_9GAMM|nr:BRCT domain-containing protein [Dyella kyungheensis]MBM7121932.1 BRCT domain-containing protein [Dyella kyungheensis]